MARFLDNCRFTPTAGGTTDWTYSTAVAGSQSPSAAGAVDGISYRYAAYSSDLTQWEIGFGAYTASSGVFARTTVLFNSSGTTSKINFSAAPSVGIVPLGEDFRELLTAARTYYVSTAGSDSNSGLTSGTAFLTIQKAWNVITGTLDLGGNTVTIQGVAGSNSFTAGLAATSAWVGGGNVTIDLGASGSIATSTTTSPIAISVPLPGTLTLQNMTLSTSSAGAVLLAHLGRGNVSLGSGVTFGNAGGGDHMQAGTGAAIKIPSSYTISGNAREHAYALTGGVIDMYAQAPGTTTTISANITLSDSFAYADPGGLILAIAAARTISLGAFTVTGKRFTAAVGGVVYTQGGGANYFPGTVAGTPATISTTGTYG